MLNTLNIRNLSSRFNKKVGTQKEKLYVARMKALSLFKQIFGDFNRYDLLQGIGLGVIQIIITLLFLAVTDYNVWISVSVGIVFNWSTTLVIWCIVKKAQMEASK